MNMAAASTSARRRQELEISADFPALQLARTGRLVRFFGRLTFTLLVVSVVAMFFVPWRQTARGTGIVAALDPQQRPQAVLSPSKGVVSYVKPGLREGSYVEKDELLLRLSPFAIEGVQQIDSQIAAVEAKRVAAESNVVVAEGAVDLQRLAGESRTKSLEESLEAAERKWEQTRNEVDALQAELDDKRNKLRIAEEVVKGGLVSREEVFSKTQAVETQRAKVLKAENAVKEAYRSMLAKEKEIEAERQEIDLKNRAAEQKVLEAQQKLETINKELIDLQTKRSELDRMEIRAPRAGAIQQWNGVAGSDTVKEGDQLFVIVPESSELAVEMKVSGNDMPLIKEGDKVRLQFEGWPAVQFVGWPSVAVGTFGGKVNRVFPTDDGKGNFRVLISPDKTVDSDSDWPDDRYLRQGVRANGWVLLKEVPLGYEIWRQLNGFPPTVVEEQPEKSEKSGGKVKLPKA